jgi:hypothetical protein
MLPFEFLDAYVFRTCEIMPNTSLNQEVFPVFFLVITLPIEDFDVLILSLIECLALDMLGLMRMYLHFLFLVCNLPLQSQILLPSIIPLHHILLCPVLTLL